jgi:hypothetical protein
MDKNRNKSITLFLLIGAAFISIILYVFVIVPNKDSDTLGSSNLVLDFPVQNWNLRYADRGIIPFCEDGNEWLSIEAEEGSSIYSSNEGTVVAVEDDIVTLEGDKSVHVEYYPLENSIISEGDYILKGTKLGNVKGRYLNFRIVNTRRKVYECPLFYLNEYGKSMIRDIEEVMGYKIAVCECNFLDY